MTTPAITQLRTPEGARQWLVENGITATAWAKQYGFKRHIVVDLLHGRTKGTRGEAHHAAIALGLKADPRPEAKTRMLPHEIRAAFNGRNWRELSEVSGYSRRAIYRILMADRKPDFTPGTMTYVPKSFDHPQAGSMVYTPGVIRRRSSGKPTPSRYFPRLLKALSGFLRWIRKMVAA